MSFELAIVRNPDGSFAGTRVVGTGEVGAITGGVQELGHALHVHPHQLRQAIAARLVPAEFVGQGRFTIPGDVVERVKSGGVRAGRAPVEDDDVQPSPLLPPSVRKVWGPR